MEEEKLYVDLFIDRIRSGFKPEKTVDVDTSVQFVFFGDQGRHNFSVIIKDQQMKVTKGEELEDPFTTIFMQEQAWLRMDRASNLETAKHIMFTLAFQSRIEFKGDRKMAVKFIEFVY